MAYSLEVRHLIGYVASKGVKFTVTDVNTPSIHVDGSYHYQEGTDGVGLAIDIAGPTPGILTPALRMLFDIFVPVERQLAELIYAGASYNIKNGVRVPPYAVTTHKNHIHVAVPRGTFLPTEVPVPDNPSLPNITGPVSFHPIVDATGKCWGYYIF